MSGEIRDNDPGRGVVADLCKSFDKLFMHGIVNIGAS
jgi:hypothetical protein